MILPPLVFPALAYFAAASVAKKKINFCNTRIDFPRFGSRFIAAMGPMHPASYSSKLKPDNDGVEDTIPDFWEMCWKTKARVVVMLCTIQTGKSLFLDLLNVSGDIGST